MHNGHFGWTPCATNGIEVNVLCSDHNFTGDPLYSVQGSLFYLGGENRMCFLLLILERFMLFLFVYEPSSETQARSIDMIWGRVNLFIVGKKATNFFL